MVMEHRNLSQMLETAIVAARLAGQHAMEKMNFTKISIKNDTDLVTQADIRCQQIIIDRIKETYPDHGFLAEEGKDGNLFKQPPRGSEPVWWVIDPIDGTNNFARGIPIFCVSIAAFYQGQPIIGVIFDPSTDSMFTAIKDSNAQLNNRRIEASDDDLNILSSFSLDSHLPDKLPNWVLEIMRQTRFRVLGSAALQFAYVARGGTIGTIFTCIKLWDIAAGIVIAESAGAIVTDWQGKKICPIDMDSYEGQPIQVLAANKKVHPKVIELLKS